MRRWGRVGRPIVELPPRSGRYWHILYSTYDVVYVLAVCRMYHPDGQISARLCNTLHTAQGDNTRTEAERLEAENEVKHLH